MPCHHPPNKALGQQNGQQIEQLPVQRNSRDLEDHKIELGFAMALLYACLALPLRSVVDDPLLCFGWEDVQHSEELNVVFQIGKRCHGKEPYAESPNPIILQSIFPRIYFGIDRIRVVRQESLKRISHESPCVPNAKTIQSGERKGSASGPFAIRSSGTLRDVCAKIAEMHFARKGEHYVHLEPDHAKDKTLAHIVQEQMKISLQRDSKQCPRPTRTPCNLRNGNGCAIAI
mmetsp:Transcript_93797/g.264948  ORF Transcript_93797/g.264948 Transcript_93797/m.264948 type:complete len:231 (+) Transcript_93797:492-1184(+)